jgi:hypothetical protein
MIPYKKSISKTQTPSKYSTNEKGSFSLFLEGQYIFIKNSQQFIHVILIWHVWWKPVQVKKFPAFTC